MADLEAVLADVSYLMAMEKSKGAPGSRAVKRMQLPDPSVRCLMMKYLKEKEKITFDEIINQEIGYKLFRDYCQHLDNKASQFDFYDKILLYESLDCEEEREAEAQRLFDELIKQNIAMHKEVPSGALNQIRDKLHKKEFSVDLFETYRKAMLESLKNKYFEKFVESEKFTRYLQWKNLELSLHLTMNDFSVHRIIGRGGFGEVYGCRKADTGTMYAMKCLDKKRIKLKHGETLALNERHMLQMILLGAMQPQLAHKIVLDVDCLENGGDLHYHLTQRGTFTEDEVRFYASEILLGLEHMHSRNIVYRDLKPANILLDEKGHTKISDLGLAHDLSVKKPHSSVGTHGYIAPEVLTRGVSYDQSADWFSYGCTVFKLLRGHSPFRTPATKDRNEIDKMTLTGEVKMPKQFSREASQFITALLMKDPRERLGCRGRGAVELKEDPFFSQVDWTQVERVKYVPPLIPPRGEVNAADAFDIGNFDDDETKGIKLCDKDQELYSEFGLVVSSRWQKEVCETIFDMVNQETDKVEAKRKSKNKIQPTDQTGDCVLHGIMYKLGGQLGITTWQKKYFYLFPNRLEWVDQETSSLVVFESVTQVREGQAKGMKYCLFITSRDSSKDIVVRCDTLPEYEQWSQDLVKTWCQAKRVLKKGPKVISTQRSVSGDANYNKAILAAQTKSMQNNGPLTRHKLNLEPPTTSLTS